jgi:hypothetical protein
MAPDMLWQEQCSGLVKVEAPEGILWVTGYEEAPPPPDNSRPHLGCALRDDTFEIIHKLYVYHQAAVSKWQFIPGRIEFLRQAIAELPDAVLTLSEPSLAGVEEYAGGARPRA